MIKMIGNDIWRGGEKIGYMDGSRVCAHDGKRIGYFEGKYIHTYDGKKVALLEEDYLAHYAGGTKIPLEKIDGAFEGAMISEIEKCAIYTLLGS